MKKSKAPTNSRFKREFGYNLRELSERYGGTKQAWYYFYKKDRTGSRLRAEIARCEAIKNKS